jgi:flagellar hook-associated protein 2
MIGISIDKSGVMSLDSAKLTAALAAKPSAVNDVFTSTNGVATRLNTKLNDILQTGGSLDSQTTSLNNQLKALTDRRAAVQTRLDGIQKTMQQQFLAMNTAVAQFKSTGAYLTRQFNTSSSSNA